MKKLVLIKIGGSLITDKSKPYSFNYKPLKNILKQLKQISTPLIISHGTGSFAHSSAKKYLIDQPITYEGIKRVEEDILKIKRIVVDVFLKQNIKIKPLRSYEVIKTNNGKIISYKLSQIIDLINKGVIPLLHGDIIPDRTKKISIYSSEQILSSIALRLKDRNYKIVKFIICGNTDGVYDNNGLTITKINKQNWKEFENSIFQTNQIDVTGGMKHKINEALKLSKYGIKTVIINGEREQELLRVLSDRNFKGTVISSQNTK